MQPYPVRLLNVPNHGQQSFGPRRSIFDQNLSVSLPFGGPYVLMG